jgi:hypothetical protein
VAANTAPQDNGVILIIAVVDFVRLEPIVLDPPRELVVVYYIGVVQAPSPLVPPKDSYALQDIHALSQQTLIRLAMDVKLWGIVVEIIAHILQQNVQPWVGFIDLA